MFVNKLDIRFNKITHMGYQIVYFKDRQKICICFHPCENKETILKEVINIMNEYDVNCIIDIHEQSGINIDFY